MDETVKVGSVSPVPQAVPRELFDHRVTPASEKLRIRVMDGPSHGNASHHYVVDGFTRPDGDNAGTELHFQNGPIVEHGVNGLTQEVLMTVVIDRLRSFQAGPFNCRENAVALTHMETALMWLQKRTRDRINRGVEGTNQK